MPTSSSSDLRVPADDPETPDVSGAYPRLTDEQIMTLSRYGDRRSVPRDRAVLRGRPRLQLLRGAGGEGRRGPRDCSGPAADRPPRPRPVPRGPGAADRTDGSRDRGGRDRAEALEVPVERLRALLAADQALGDLILRAFLLRRTLQATSEPACGSSGRSSTRTPATPGLREPQPDPHQWVDLEEDPQAEPCAPRVTARRDTCRRLEGPTDPAEPQQHRAGRPHRAASGAGPGGVRPRRGWRRPGRSGRGGLRRIRGAQQSSWTPPPPAAKRQRPPR